MRANSLAAVAALLASCATTPPPAVPTPVPTAAPMPAPGALAPPSRPAVQRVEWGGQIVAIENRRDSTELEVLAYPLDSGGRPDASVPSIGRFVLLRAGFLDPAEYAPGRLVTASGTVTGPRPGAAGSSRTRLATLEAETLRLWPRDAPASRVVPYGTIGIGFGSGGSYGGGVGIGIGF